MHKKLETIVRRLKPQAKQRTVFLIWIFMFAIFPALTSFQLSPNSFPATIDPIAKIFHVGTAVCGVCIPVTVCVVLLAMFPKLEKACRGVLSVSLVCGSALLVGLWASGAMRDSFCQVLNSKTKLLTKAISVYEFKEGHPPENLTKLIPGYLSEIPTSGVGASPAFNYQIAQNIPNVRWQLRLRCPVENDSKSFSYYVYNSPLMLTTSRYAFENAEKDIGWTYYWRSYPSVEK